MSFYYVKSIKLDRDNNKITMEAAESNVYPRTWFYSEYGAKENISFEEKVKNMLFSMMAGNLKPSASSKYYKIISECEEYLAKVSAGYDVFKIDLEYSTDLYDQAVEKILTLYAIPALLEGRKQESNQLLQFLKEYPNIVKETIAQRKKELEDKGIVVINSARCSNIFSKMDVLADNQNNTWLAPKENYKPGRLDNSKGDALCFGDNPVAWDVLIGMSSTQYTSMLENETLARCILEIENKLKDKDMYLESLWENLKDVHTDKDEFIDQFWFIFKKGTFREDIWHWFDAHYSKGVAKLMFKN